MTLILRIRKLFRFVSPKIADDGFSMIEALMAMSILSIGMLGTGALALGVIKANMVSKNVTAATTLAQDKMEIIQEMGYSGLPSSDQTEIEDYGSIIYSPSAGSAHYSETPLPSEETEPDDEHRSLPSSAGIVADYLAFRRVTSTEIDSPVAGMKTVTVRVYWRMGRKPVALKTIFAE